MAIKYICISDLHLGAQYSLLTSLDPKGHVDSENGECATLDTLAEAFNELLENLGENVNDNTRLVLLGDVLDMGFSSTSDTIKAFRVFARKFLGKPQMKKICSRLLYIPGNHDHQLWQEEKTQNLLHNVQKDSGDDSLMQVTQLLNPEILESGLLQYICRSPEVGLDLDVQIAYPNYASVLTNQNIEGRDQNRAVILSHGHYIESTYLLISHLKAALEGEPRISTSISDIEGSNGIWINALWSNLGNMGLGQDGLELYQTLLDAGATHELVRAAAHRITNFLANEFGITSGALAFTKTDITVDQVVRVLMDTVIGKFGNSERNNFSSVLSISSIEGLKWYLSKVVAAQFENPLTKSIPELLPNDIRFIFGHTHKPFQDQIPVDGYLYPANVFNTGGWAIDKPDNAPLIGGAIVFVDDKLDVSSLRLYNCDRDNQAKLPYIAEIGSESGSSSALFRQLEDALSNSMGQWQSFTKAITKDVETRQKLVLDRYFNPKSPNGTRATGSLL